MPEPTNDFTISIITEEDAEDIRTLAREMWPNQTTDGGSRDLSAMWEDPRQAGFLARDESGEVAGIINVTMRYDYVPGATRAPFAYLDGIYVREAFRNRGVGIHLMNKAEQWAFTKGCCELAADTLLDNVTSYKFHQRCGFREVERVVSFVKTIKSPFDC